jgi:hypothetical protein
LRCRDCRRRAGDGIVDPPPPALLTKAIKPLASNTGWNKALTEALPQMKAAEAELGAPIAGVDDALEATALAKKKLWALYSQKLEAAGNAGAIAPGKYISIEQAKSIDGNQIADAMEAAIDARTRSQNPALVKRIEDLADTYRRNMTMEEAEDYLQSANADLHGFYAKNKVGRQVAERDPETGHVVAEADALRDALYGKLDELTGPGAADLKRTYGSLTNVQNELLRRQNVAARQQPESLAEQLGYARAVGKIAVGVARGSPSSVLEGTQSIAAAKWLKQRGTTDAMIQRAFAA